MGGRQLDDLVAGIVDEIDVVARPALHRVRARAAVEDVGGPVADQQVGAGIAGGVDHRAAGQGQVLDSGRQRMGDAGLDQVGALARHLDHRIARRIDDIDIVPQPAAQTVVANATVQAVVAGQAVELISVTISSDRIAEVAALNHFDTRQLVETNPCARIVRRGSMAGGKIDRQGVHRIIIKDVVDSSTAVDHILIQPASKIVIAGAAVQRVIAVAARQLVIALASIEKIIAVVALQGVGAKAPVQIVIASPALNGIVAVVTVESFVARHADQRVRPAAAIDKVGAAASADPVVEPVANQRVGVARPGKIFDRNEGIGTRAAGVLRPRN